MQTPEIEKTREQRRSTDYRGTIVAVLFVPVVLVVIGLAIPFGFVSRWMRQRREHKFKLLMKSRGRFITWPDLLRRMHDEGGTCIEERFASKGPVRFWWTQEDVHKESPYEIIDWFTMRKGRKGEPFIHWCRARYTSGDTGSAVLADTTLVPKREIYTLWAECRSEANAARWVEVAPPEILPRRPGQ